MILCGLKTRIFSTHKVSLINWQSFFSSVVVSFDLEPKDHHNLNFCNNDIVIRDVTDDKILTSVKKLSDRVSSSPDTIPSYS